MDEHQSRIVRYSASLPSVLLTGGIAIAFFTLLAGATTVWHEHAAPALLSLRHGLIFAALGIALSFLVGAHRGARPALLLPLWAALSLLFIFSDWLPRGYTFFHGALIRGELLLCAAAVYVMIRANRLGAFKLLLPLSLLLLGGIFLAKTSGRLLFSDDLATFLYRLSLLKERFPHIPFYNPQWNGGIDQRDFFATGALNVFLISSPLVYLTDLLTSFNWIVGGLLFVLTPACTVAAAFLLGFNGIVASVAGTLAMTSGILWYKWALSFGTLGFITSTALFPLFLALALRFITKDRPISLPLAFFFAALTSLVLLWSPAGLAAIPTIACCVAFLRTTLSKRHSLTAAILIVVINLPWIAAFWSVSKVGAFIHPEINRGQLVQGVENAPTEEGPSLTASNAAATAPAAPHIKQIVRTENSSALSTLRESAIFTNPFLLIMIPAGVLMLTGRARVLYLSTAIWLALLGTVGAHLRPQLELERMLVMLSLIGAVPAAVAFEGLLQRARLNPWWNGPILPTAAVGSFLLLGPFAVTSFFEQRTLVRYYVADGVVRSMVDAINTHGGEGRVLFAGFLLHDVSGGHAAPLALMTKKPLMASSHVHNLWQYKGIFPQEYEAQGDVGIQRYLDLYNVTAVLAHEQKWREYFLARPKQFAPVWEGGKFILFTRQNYTPSYFLHGQGTVLNQSTHSVSLQLDTPEATVKFNYLPFLKAPGCKVSSAPFEGEVNLLALSNCPVGTVITVESEGLITRLKGVH